MNTLTRDRLDVARIREDFPILGQKIRGHDLAYLDSAATTQKPQVVLDTIDRYYREQNANVHRGVHALSERATNAYENARKTVARFLGAATEREIVFTRGATEAVNLVANTFGEARVSAGDEVLITEMEHHSNIVPWQMLCERKGAKLRVVPVDDRGDLILEELERLLTDRTKILAVTHVSNALGTVNPVREIIALAHERGVPVLIDGAQAVHHLPVDVQDLGCDFYVFSGHKVYGPTGIGALYGRLEHLEAMPPWQGGGDMILTVSFDGTTYNKAPQKFEAGTPNIAGAAGLAAALDYLQGIGLEVVMAAEAELLAHGTSLLEEIPGLTLIGTAREKTSVLSFVIDGIHPHDIGTLLDAKGIAIRAGHHCAQPLMARYGVPATTRASLAVYNTAKELDRLAEGLMETVRMFG